MLTTTKPSIGNCARALKKRHIKYSATIVSGRVRGACDPFLRGAVALPETGGLVTPGGTLGLPISAATLAAKTVEVAAL